MTQATASSSPHTLHQRDCQHQKPVHLALCSSSLPNYRSHAPCHIATGPCDCGSLSRTHYQTELRGPQVGWTALKACHALVFCCRCIPLSSSVMQTPHQSTTGCSFLSTMAGMLASVSTTCQRHCWEAWSPKSPVSSTGCLEGPLPHQWGSLDLMLSF